MCVCVSERKRERAKRKKARDRKNVKLKFCDISPKSLNFRVLGRKEK